MASFENCPPDVELVSVATLESIFEMEQVVVRLDEQKIPWRVVEHDSKLFKSLSGSLGHATLYVETGRESEAVELLVAHRKQQLEGRECPGCKLWLGPSVDVCPACGTDYQTAQLARENGEEVEGAEDDDDELEDEDEVDQLFTELENLLDIMEQMQTTMGQLVSRIESLEEEVARLRPDEVKKEE
jgi:hypothetical protein